jgi:cytochrome c oxidase assembly factor CtaG
LVVLGLALLGPLGHAGSLSLHMVQHMLLLVAAPPLLLAGRPLLRLFPQGWRRGAAGAAPILLRPARPLAAALVQGVVLWLWHLPGPFAAAEARPWLHAIEHMSLLAAALLFWAALLDAPRRGREGPPLAALAALITLMHTGFLGAILAWAPRPLYPGAALPDQQLAGLIMWVPGGVAYVAAGLWVLGRWLRRLEHRPDGPIRHQDHGGCGNGARARALPDRPPQSEARI